MKNRDLTYLKILSILHIIVSGVMLIVMFPIIYISLIVAGIKLRKIQSRTFCLIIAGLECISFPLGTLLGVFTLITLNRESVKTLFAAIPMKKI